ncbi:MAG: hypothetical protein LC687_05865 [Actinobacteria bacterium]|nr:hypothetical protein [Actinomycetota bacterium]
MNHELDIGYIVSIEGSDTLWVIQDIEKGSLSLLDEVYGTIELNEVPLREVTGVLGREEVA